MLRYTPKKQWAKHKIPAFVVLVFKMMYTKITAYCTKGEQTPLNRPLMLEVIAMELRVLRYFLMVAREENITKSAHLLHITQPTLSRQLMQLEEELGVTLLKRGKHNIVLTDDGMLLKQRAQEIISLADKTEQEFLHREDTLTGEIAIGCGETRNMGHLSKHMASFRELYPLVHFSIYSAIADDIKDRIEKGLLDMGLLMEPVEIAKYETVRMPEREQWGILVRKDSSLAEKERIHPEDLVGVPLIMAKRDIVRDKLAEWFGDCYDQLQIAATYTLVLNAMYMVEQHVGVALSFAFNPLSDHLCYVPFAPKLENGAVLAWKKHQAFSPAAAQFMKHIKNAL